MELVIGRRYCYWNRSTYEIKPSLKTCKLLHISKDGKKCRVKREDLTVHAVLSVATKRLKEIEPEQGELNI